MSESWRAQIVAENIAARLDSIAVYDGEELEGYRLVDTWNHQPVTPVRCCRTCAWADAKHVRYASRATSALIYEQTVDPGR